MYYAILPISLSIWSKNTQWLKNLSGEIFIQVATLEGGIPGASIFCIWRIFVYSEDQSMMSRRHSRNNVRSRSPVAHKNAFLDLLAVFAIFRRLTLTASRMGGKITSLSVLALPTRGRTFRRTPDHDHSNSLSSRVWRDWSITSSVTTCHSGGNGTPSQKFLAKGKICSK
jgi:hypothetical protein